MLCQCSLRHLPTRCCEGMRLQAMYCGHTLLWPRVPAREGGCDGQQAAGCAGAVSERDACRGEVGCLTREVDRLHSRCREMAASTQVRSKSQVPESMAINLWPSCSSRGTVPHP